MPLTPNSMYNTNTEYFLRVVLGNIDTNIAALSGGATAVVKPVSATTVYDTNSAQVLAQVVMSDGSIKYYDDASATNEIAASTIAIGAFPSGAGASISLGAGAVDATTTRVDLTTESQTVAGKTGTAQWVKDTTTGTIVWQEVIYDAVAGSFDYAYTLSPTGGAFTVASTVEPADISSTNTIDVKKVDDVAGDGTGALVNYVEIWSVADDGTTVKLSDRTRDLSAAYTLQGVSLFADEVGVGARTIPFQITLPVGVWVPTSDVYDFAYGVFVVGDVNDPPTFTDQSGEVNSLYASETGSYPLIEGTEQFNIGATSIEVKAGDVIKVYGTKISA